MRFPWQEPSYSDQEYFDTYRDDWYRPWSALARWLMVGLLFGIIGLDAGPVPWYAYAICGLGVIAASGYTLNVLRTPAKVRFEGESVRLWFPLGREELWPREGLRILRYRSLLVIERRRHGGWRHWWYDRAFVPGDRPSNRRLQEHLERWYGPGRIEVKRA